MLIYITELLCECCDKVLFNESCVNMSLLIENTISDGLTVTDNIVIKSTAVFYRIQYNEIPAVRRHHKVSLNTYRYQNQNLKPTIREMI